MLAAVKNLIPFRGRTIGSDRVTKLLSFALIVGLLQTLSWTYQIFEAPKAFGARTFNVGDSGSITVPTGVDTVTVTVIGGGAGWGGKDGGGNTNPQPGARGKVTATFRVTAGEVLGIWPGSAGSNGTDGANNSGGGSGGVSTLNSNLNGGTGGNAGSSGGSGGGGGGGAASVFTIGDVNTYQIVAGGAGGGGGQSNAANTGQPGKDDNSQTSNSSVGGTGVQTTAGNSAPSNANPPCNVNTNDGGGGGGGGGGFGNGGGGGRIINGASGECAGDGGYRGGNYTGSRALSITTGIDNTSNTSAGQILLTYQLNRPTNVTFSEGYRRVSISWDRTNAPSGYLVRLYNASENFLTSKSVDSSTSSFAFTPTDYPEMKNGTAYKLSVTASGDGSLTDTSTETVRTTVTTASIGTIYDTDTAISLNGTGSQQVYASDSAYNRIPDTFTSQAWIYPTSYGCTQLNADSNDDYCHILSKGNHFSLLLASSSNAGGAGGTSGQLGFIWSGSIKFSSFKIPLNEWHHVAFSREGASSSQAKLYVDGNLIYEDTATANSAVTTRDFVVGGSRSDATVVDSIYGKFRGQIDEVKVSSRFRTQSEIRTDMHNHNETDSSFQLYYDFNEVTGSYVYNRINNANSGTDLTITFTPRFDSSKIFLIDTTTASAYTTIQFFRTYLVTGGGWRSPSNVSAVRYLVVGGGGGGGGGYNGGGGGAGGYRESNTAILPNTVYNIEVGVGGIGALGKYANTSGTDSAIRRNSLQTDSITASGGGKGATEQQITQGPNANTSPDGSPSSGGSGGGGTHGATYSGTGGGAGNKGNYSPPEGYVGGTGASGGTETTYYLAGGGGGGAGGAGGNADLFMNGNPGSGGIGKTSYITGRDLNLAGGGAGAGRFRVNSPTDVIKHGSSSFGGGNGACTSSCTIDTGTAGSVNTGGGGGGGAAVFGTAFGGNGGSGFVVIKYITSKPVITKQPVSDTVTVGAVETFTITTSAEPSPLTKSVNWQFTADTTTTNEANITGWTNLTTGTGLNTDTYTTTATTSAMNKYRYRAIVTFSDTASVTSVETSTIAVLTINGGIIITADSSTITRKYGDTQTVRTITYSGGTTSSGAVGTPTSHSVTTPNRPLAGGKIWVDTTTSTAYFKVDTGTAVGTYMETITVTDFSGISASYTQRVVVNPADTLTVQADTLTAITYNPNSLTINPTASYSGFVNSDTQSAITYTFTSPASCAQGGLCNLGDTGPGGGTIFYDAGSTQSWGRYIEASPIDWYTVAKGGPGSDTFTWCSNSSFAYFNGLPGYELIDAIGYGRANLSNLWTGCDFRVTSSAPGFLSSYTVNGKNDWFLPSLTELDALNNYSNGILTQKFYWVAWDTSANVAQTPAYGFGGNAWPYRALGGANKTEQYSIRPMRYVTPNTNLMSYNSMTPPTTAGTYKITPSALVLANNVDTSNYVSVNYQSSTFSINKNVQDSLTITSRLGTYNGGTSSMQLTTRGGTDTGTVTYAIVSGGTASGCSVSTNVLSFTSAGTCRLTATKAATLNYLIAYSDTVTITLSAFVSNQQVQTQSVPTQLPINGANGFETATVTAALLTITGVTNSGGGAYTIAGTGFTNVSVVRIGGTDLVLNTNYTVTSTIAISITNASGMVGPLFIYLSDGQLAVRFEFPN